MLPDWDFNKDDEKRRVFISWVWKELDRFAALAGVDRSSNEDISDWDEILSVSATAVGRPVNPAGGMNDLIWEYAMLRFMFNRYWPRRKRRATDPAHAANIVIGRCKVPIPKSQRTAARIEAREQLRDRLLDEWERRSKNPGWIEAQKDIAILEALPPALFEK